MTSPLIERMATEALARMRMDADVRIAEEQRRGRARYHSAIRSIAQRFRYLREQMRKGKA